MMTKQKLQQVLSAPFNLDAWRTVLFEVFGAKQFHQQPQPILLPSNNKADSAFELGSFHTADDRLIGLYQVNVLPNVWLERNKVGLRELLRHVYKYDVDGALIVFVQNDKWRLSFVSEIRALDEDGNPATVTTEPKRYTYLLGKDEKTKTPVDRLYSLAGKPITLEDIRNAFSVEALNEEFYKIVARHFYQLVGATAGKGKKVVKYERLLQLPDIDPTKNDSDKIYQEFAVRLIGRIIFSWFLKMKKSDSGIPLLPEELLSSQAVKKNKNYYHTILERLFFQILNTPIDQRVNNLPQGSEMIPFLNGGLFEPHPDDFYQPHPVTGLNQNLNTLKIPDEWFLEFFQELEKYNFTIDENSVVDIEVSVDPEMLGRIFENLLAEIDPDSGETARKATGSYYTPREIVDYMATESLLYYLNNKSGIEIDRLRPIFKMDESVSFRQDEKEKILDALDKLTVLDPACGSGAFPIGVMQKIVMALQKLDPNASWWKERQISRIDNPILKKQIKEKLDTATVEYARKLGIIQNSLFGVDIQPIAAEISKLRCFLTLIVDENIDENKPNRGVEPLPNLEFKFVTANTLIGLPKESAQGHLFDNHDELKELKKLRKLYLQSWGREKEEIKTKFLSIQNKIFKQQLRSYTGTDSRAYMLSSWNPFDHSKTDWFDSEWMLGTKNFDIVIGNPPYVDSEKMTKINKEYRDYLKLNYLLAKGNWDLFIIFIERGIELLKYKGIFSFIVPNKLIGAKYAKDARLFLNSLSLIEIRDYSRINVFRNTDVYPITILLAKNKITPSQNTIFIKIKDGYKIQSRINIKLFERKNDIFWDKYFLDSKLFNLLININKHKKLEMYNNLSITASATVSEAYQIKNVIIDKKELNNSFYFINTGTIDPYISLWGKKHTQYIKRKYQYPRIKHQDLININKARFIQSKSTKIIIAGMSISIEAFFDENGSYYAGKSTTIVIGNRDFLCFITAILNSRLINFYISNNYLSLKMAGGYLNINTDIIKSIPIPETNINIIKLFVNLVNYIVFIYSLENIKINTHVPNSHIAIIIKEVIDAMVVEVYFKDELKKAGIEFIKCIDDNFPPIEGLSEEEKIKTIRSVYQKLRQKDNEIMNNLKLMDIRLADLIGPIKAVG
ncbi:hypothetical protein Calab_3101 [Caldithrix abyssi DSM 13497]|uniref:site-specific DNA-methyltransferase (adenine-specific) n=1 Tax=Caldithrix abyssi DSM 13497 TaxID=880073 RepID=H1XTU0_CALAY|nr:N-6 DNA methylase [Caldithrix abyssi]APF18727.1 TaqI-like C-terminal specificity domain-containing protein [Caldithrix abyssi DSM 13497]EHO42707.1 hypothetical protein Calab_3101 [Caldithrix abyssi DSM 13497]